MYLYIVNLTQLPILSTQLGSLGDHFRFTLDLSPQIGSFRFF